MNYQNWKIPYRQPALSPQCSEAGYPPLLALLLSQKELSEDLDPETYLRCDITQLQDPYLLRGMEAAVERIKEAISAQETVAVFGDYDVDGITSTCLMTDFLTQCGLTVYPYIPDRLDEGYGLNNDAISNFCDHGVSLIVTVDCGITASEEVSFASELGIDVIITDHHECQEGIPLDAVAVVNPRQTNCHYPNKDLAGVGVALKVACAVSGKEEEMLRRYGEWAAIGTIADVMPLTEENRFLVKTGLDKIAHNPSPGVDALLIQSGTKGKKITSTSVGYTLAPRLNASGRLGQAMVAYRLLTETEPRKAQLLAEELCELNRQRQEIETEMSIVAAKVRQLTKMQNELDDVKGSGVLSRMESYNNSSAEISFLYDILAETQQYNIEFSDITRNGDQIRRNFSLKFRTRDYDAMRSVINRLCASEYRCLVDEIRCQRTINDRESYVTANVTATFYETMVGGKPDAGLPKDSAVPDTETR